MPFTRRRRSRPRGGARSGRPARQTAWARNITTLTVASDEPAIFLPLGAFRTAYEADLLGCTISRMRYSLRAVQSGGTDAAELIVGLRVSNEAVFEGEVTAPVELGPATDLHANWMWWKDHFSNVGIDTDRVDIYAEEDVRAQRRMPELGQNLVMLFDTPRPEVTQVVQVATSTLLTLP